MSSLKVRAQSNAVYSTDMIWLFNASLLEHFHIKRYLKNMILSSQNVTEAAVTHTLHTYFILSFKRYYISFLSNYTVPSNLREVM